MNKENASKLWKIIQEAGDYLKGQLPDHPNHPKGRNPYAHVAICVKSKFQKSYKDIEDDRFQEVLDYIEFLKKMKKGDLCFFYHSNIGKEIVGIVEVIKTAFTDPTDKTNTFVAIKVKYKKKIYNPITLENIKKNASLKGLALIKQSRLSVMPIDTKCWKNILKMGNIN